MYVSFCLFIIVIFVFACLRLLMYVSVRIFLHMFVSESTCLPLCVYVCVRVYMYDYVCICMLMVECAPAHFVRAE